MYTELLMGALVAIASPQDVQDEKIEVRESKTIEIEIPAIEIPGFDIYVPGFEIVVPSYGWVYDWDEHEIDFEGFEVSIPEIAISLPVVYVDDWSWDDDDWDYQDVDTDTTFDVNPNAVLGVRNHGGEIIIRTWDRDQVRLEASHSSDDRVKIIHSESSVKIKSEARHGHPDEVDYEITIPRTMAVDLWGFDSDISVDGARNGVRAETLSGDMDLRDVEGEISLRSVEGDITVVRGQGSLEVNGVEGEVSVLDFEGDILAESIDGDITLSEIASDRVEAKTVDGDVQYDGTIRDDGRYRLTTHDGDVVVSVPADVNATVSVATFDGEFEAEFPVQLKGAEASRKLSFTLGDGSARLELHSFDGDIRLVRR
jgi:DUF4097 and DUF4098 domain-containing protein YvlB